jgi:Tfp pilus assembly protein PilO
VKPFWRRRLLPVFLGLLALNALVLAAWTAPRELRRRNAAARVEAARLEASRERETAARLEERAEAIRQNEADLRRFYEQLAASSEGGLLPLLEELEEMARAPGLKPGRRGYSRSPVPAAPLERVAVTLPLDGSYAQLVGFLRAVERSERFLTVDRISLRGDAEGRGTLQVELSTYLALTRGEGAGRTGGAR